jgi:hypothetical protein
MGGSWWRYDGLLREIGTVCQWPSDAPSSIIYDILRKIEKPAKYRPFANAEEFDAFNHLRFRHKARKSERRFASYYDRQGLRMDDGDAGSFLLEWGACFLRLEFIDGTPFGVRAEE